MRYLLTPLAPDAPAPTMPGQPAPLILTLPDGGPRYTVRPLPAKARVVSLGAGAFILDLPAAPTVADVAAHLAAPVPVPVPEVISPAQLRVWLIRRGIPLSAVDDAIAALPEGPGREEAKARWEHSTEIHRANPLVGGIAAALQMDDAAVDQAFTAAAKL